MRITSSSHSVVKNTIAQKAIVRKQRLTLAAMCLALGTAALDDTVVNVALPSLQADLDMSVSQLQWILNAYLLPIACLVLPAGALGDRYSRARIFLTGLLGFVIASIFVGFSATGQMAIAGRLLQGIGAAALLPSSLAILSDAYPNPTERTKAIGIWSGVSGLALIVGPALGGILVDALGWRSTFFLNVPMGAATFWLTVCALSQKSQTQKPQSQKSQSQKSQQINSEKPQQRRFFPLDWLGMGLSVVAIASFITLLMANTVSLSQSLLLGCVALGSAIAFFKTEANSAYPMLPLSLFRQPTFATAFVVNALLLFMLVSLLFLFSLFLQQVQGYSPSAAGIRFLPLNAAFILASVISGYFSARLGWRWTITLGFSMAGVAVLSLSQVQFDTPFRVLVVRLTLVGFGVGFTLSPLTAAGMSSLCQQRSGMAAALMNTSTRLGGALGIAIQGNIFTDGMKQHLAQQLSATELSPQVQAGILAEALSHNATRPAVLMEQLALGDASAAAMTFSELEYLIHQAFVSGLRSVLWTGAIALFIGAGLSAAYIQSHRAKFKAKQPRERT